MVQSFLREEISKCVILHFFKYKFKQIIELVRMVQSFLREGISKCITLISLDLDLRNNRISENGAKYLREGISKCVILTSLNKNLIN